jgi:flagellar basal-body rod protein FlgC
MDLATSMMIAASGMRAQSSRMRTIAENLANANSTSPTPGGDPYRRRVSTMTSEFDRELGATLVQSGRRPTRAISIPNTSPAIRRPIPADT